MSPKNITAAIVIVAFLALGGCAIETPKFYVKIPNTGYSAYGYAGGGIAVDPDADTLATGLAK